MFVVDHKQTRALFPSWLSRPYFRLHVDAVKTSLVYMTRKIANWILYTCTSVWFKVLYQYSTNLSSMINEFWCRMDEWDNSIHFKLAVISIHKTLLHQFSNHFNRNAMLQICNLNSNSTFVQKSFLWRQLITSSSKILL